METLFADPVSNFSRQEWKVREVSTETVRRWVTTWHYSHRYPGGGTVGYGAFAPDMVALVTTSNATNASGLARRYSLDKYPGNIEISRVVAHPDAPKNTPSRAISACFRLWSARGWEWVFSYADTGQNHHGGIYQALNAIYVGKSPGRHGYLLDGEPIHPRSVVSKFGTESWPRVRELAKAEGHELLKVAEMNTAKHVYILPVGGPASRRAIRDALAPFTLPYPKRRAPDNVEGPSRMDVLGASA